MLKYIKYFCKSYWELSKSLLYLQRYPMIKILGMLCVIIAGTTYGIHSLDIKYFDSWLKQGFLSILLLLFIPYLCMPIFLIKRHVDLINQVNNRQKKDQLVLKLKTKVEELRKDDLLVDRKINYFDFINEICQLMKESEVMSEADIFIYQTDAFHAYTQERKLNLILDIIKKLKY